MKAIALRGIDEVTYNTIKKVSQHVHLSMNRLILNIVKDNLGIEKKQQKKNFDCFFGSWDEDSYQNFLKNIHSFSGIDKELWD